MPGKVSTPVCSPCQIFGQAKTGKAYTLWNNPISLILSSLTNLVYLDGWVNFPSTNVMRKSHYSHSSICPSYTCTTWPYLTEIIYLPSILHSHSVGIFFGCCCFLFLCNNLHCIWKNDLLLPHSRTCNALNIPIGLH